MRFLTIGRWATGLASLIAWLPSAAIAADNRTAPTAEVSVVSKSATDVIDVALEDRGTLVGQVTTPSGAPQPEAAVSIRQGSHVVARATTDKKGIFYVTGLRGGVYQVAPADVSQSFRAWAPNTAPPSARPGVQLVRRQPLTRSQGPVLNFLSRPVVIGGLVATAIAVPIAVHNNNSSSGATTVREIE
ncbi:MAG: carboxypeptidase-like regulatory domain-containing protein [Pirellulales bacterium]